MRKFLLITASIATLMAVLVWQLNQLASDTSLSQWQADAPGYRQAMTQKEQIHKPVLLFFHTDWCQSCKELETNVLGQPRVIKYLNKFIPVQIDPELNKANYNIADQYAVTGYPTLLLIHSGSQTAIRLPIGGKSNIEKFIAVCELALRKENT